MRWKVFVMFHVIPMKMGDCYVYVHTTFITPTTMNNKRTFLWDSLEMFQNFQKLLKKCFLCTTFIVIYVVCYHPLLNTQTPLYFAALSSKTVHPLHPYHVYQLKGSDAGLDGVTYCVRVNTILYVLRLLASQPPTLVDTSISTSIKSIINNNNYIYCPYCGGFFRNLSDTMVTRCHGKY